MGSASLAFTIRVEKDTHHLAGLTAVASLGEQGTLTLDLALSNWDQPMDISPPPADQIKPALAPRAALTRPIKARAGGPTYNGRVSPTRRRRAGHPTLDDAAEAAPAVGTAFADLADAPAAPGEPAWMRDAPASRR